MTQPNVWNAKVGKKNQVGTFLVTTNKPTAVRSTLHTPPLLPHGDRCPTFAIQHSGHANL